MIVCCVVFVHPMETTTHTIIFRFVHDVDLRLITVSSLIIIRRKGFTTNEFAAPQWKHRVLKLMKVL